MIITSKDNETIKKIRKLKDKKYRDVTGKYIIEGVKLIKEAIEEEANIDTIVVCDNCVKNGEIEQSVLYEIAKYLGVGYNTVRTYKSKKIHYIFIEVEYED